MVWCHTSLPIVIPAQAGIQYSRSVILSGAKNPVVRGPDSRVKPKNDII
jgi:hypothetical protein